MDLIEKLSGTLGMDSSQAQALAGSLLGGIKGQVEQEVGAPEAGAFAAAIPELSQWTDLAKNQLGGDEVKETGSDGLLDLVGQFAGAGGGTGGLLGAAAGLLGGGDSGKAEGFDLGGIMSLMKNFNLDGSKAGDLGGLVLGFLQERLPGELMKVLGEKVPMLSFLTKSQGAGGLVGGLLGNLLGSADS